ncbi:hypothetical protein SAXI111661_19580 [Saccharomonospora xinjiangensis]
MTDTGRAVRDADRGRVSLTTPQASVTDTGRAVRDADRGRVSLTTPQASVTNTRAAAVTAADRDARERHWRLR